MKQGKVLMQMKKLKLPIMVCALLFGLWFMSGDVSAATIRQTKTSTKANPVSYIDYISRADGKYDMKVKIDLSKGTYTQTELTKIKGYRLIVLNQKGEVYSTQDAGFSYNYLAETPYILATKPITPGATFGIMVWLYSDETFETIADISDYSNQLFTAPDAYNISTDKKAPVSISLGESAQEIKGPAGVQGNYVYYAFTLKDAATITGTISGIGTCYLYNENGTQVYRENCSSETEINWELPAGTYLFEGSPSARAEYSLKLKSTPFNWGTVKIQWGNRFPCMVNKNIPFTVTVTGGDSSVEIFNIIPSSGSVEETSKTKTTVNGNLVGREGGEHTLSVYLVANFKNFGQKKVNFSYSCKPESPSCKLTVVKNAATLNVYTKNSYVDVYMNGKWKTYKASDYKYCLKLKSLKANTKYKYRAYVTENGYKSDYNEQTFYTAHKAKPSIKSIKVSKVKKIKYPRRWVSGYYDVSGRWRSGYYAPAYTMTSYKLTVTLKKNPPKGASTYVVINGNYIRVKGKKYTITGKYVGKSGKKIKVYVRYGRNKGYGGLGTYISKKVKVK